MAQRRCQSLLLSALLTIIHHLTGPATQDSPISDDDPSMRIKFRSKNSSDRDAVGMIHRVLQNVSDSDECVVNAVTLSNLFFSAPELGLTSHI